MIMSFDCFLQETKLLIFGESTILLKALLISVMPIVIVLFFYFILFCLKLCLWWRISLKRLLVVCLITIIFFVYSNISSLIISLFSCTSINGVSRLSRDLELICWEGKHLAWTLGFALPLVVVWVFGMPFSGILFLSVFWKRVESQEFINYFILLF